MHFYTLIYAVLLYKAGVLQSAAKLLTGMIAKAIMP